MSKIIDLRSDTVTKPSEEMRKAMYEAEVGDDVYREDPTANALEKYAAELFNVEAALFVPTGMMGNQICLRVLTQRGDEVICERGAHIFQYESGSAAGLSGIQLNLVDGVNGVFTPEQVESYIRPESAYYMPRTRVVEIENTHNNAGGTIHPIENIAAIQEITDQYSIYLHCDGARIWNASVASGVALSEYASYFDSMSCCLSKGLGAPVGSLILGTKGFIEEAFRVRKAMGGGMRQIGILAAAGLYALQNNIDRLEEDHDLAYELAEHLSSIPEVEIDLDNVETNIIMFKPLKKSVEDVISECKEKGLLLGPAGVGIVRAVTHLDVSENDINDAKVILSEVLETK